MKTHAPHGFTLLETLIACVILVIAVAAVSSVLVAGTAMTRNGEESIETADTAGLAGEMISTTLRAAGIGSGNGMMISVNGNATNISPIFGSDGQTDTTTLGYGLTANAGDLSDEFWAVVPDANALGEPCSALPGNGEATAVTKDLKNGALPVTCATSFKIPDLLLVTQLKSSALISVTGLNNSPPSINYAEQGITGFADSPTGFRAGDQVFRAHIYHFYLAIKPGAVRPSLYRKSALPGTDPRGWPFIDDPNPVSALELTTDNIEDLQVAYGLDPGNTGDPNQYTFVPSLPCGAGGKPFCVHPDLRSVRVSVVSSSRRVTIDTNNGMLKTSFPLQTENHVPSAPSDGRRRSVYSRRIELANMATSNL